MIASPVVLLLAAGRGERFTASGATVHKLDALLNGQPVLTHTLRAVQAAGLPWYLVRPEGFTRGMGESIALGVNATSDADGWLILPADLPLIQPASLQRVAQALAETDVVVPHCQQQQGHPVGFGRRYLTALLKLTGDRGAREIVRQARAEGRVQDLHLDDAGIVEDIDTLHDLDAAARLLALRAYSTCQ